jgi:phosphoribosyl 1,2-cyclic phosphate phosphodiesterase
LIARVAPRRAVLTNLHTDLDYGRLAAELPDGIAPAYDGLVIETSATNLTEDRSTVG